MGRQYWRRGQGLSYQSKQENFKYLVKKKERARPGETGIERRTGKYRPNNKERAEERTSSYLPKEEKCLKKQTKTQKRQDLTRKQSKRPEKRQKLRKRSGGEWLRSWGQKPTTGSRLLDLKKKPEKRNTRYLFVWGVKLRADDLKHTGVEEPGF